MSDHERVLLIDTLALIVTIGLVFFGFKPVLASYHDNTLALAARKQELSDIDSRKAELTSLDVTLRKYSAQIGQLKNAVPASDDYPEIIIQLGSLADRSQLVLSSIQPVPDPTNDQTTGITVTVRGTFPQILDYAEHVENNLRPIKVRSINMVQNGDRVNGDQLNATIQMSMARSGSRTASTSASATGGIQ